MKAKAFCSLAVLIILLSTISYSQTLDAPKIKGKACYDLMKEQSECEQRMIFSLGGGYAGLFEETSRPNGFNIQADVLYPVEDYFALNLGLSLTHFPGYYFKDSYISYDMELVNYWGDAGAINQLHILPGVSFGNFNRTNKFNYYLTAGLTLGVSRESEGTYNDSYLPLNVNVIKPSYDFSIGGFVSGRISYKVSDKLNIFIEPAAVSNWSDNTFSNYHINGGVSLNL